MALLWSYLALGAVTALALVAERLWPGRARQGGEWAVNGAAFLLNAVGGVLIAPVVILAEAGLVARFHGGLIDLTVLPLAAGAAIYLVAMDLGEYLYHRAQHAVPWLWAMHSLHHSDTAMNATTAQRHFWAEPALKAGSVWLAVALAFKTNGPILAVYSAATLYHVFAHANVRVGFGRLSFLLNSPGYHRLHHSRDPAHFNTNFAALLPIFDVIAGSYRPAAREPFPATGLEDDAVSRPVELMIWPARAILRGAQRTA
jgi:sterol desaturase/sphingolipid hydroxylase (fatty acid hydroxylase superfamily)